MNKSTLLSLLMGLSLIVIGFTSCITKQKNNTMPDKKVNRQTDEELVRKTEAAYDEAWLRGDIDGILSHFTDDALLISPRNDVAVGKAEIRNLFQNLLTGEARNSKHTSRITRINFVSDDVAVVDGVATIEGASNLPATLTQHRFTDILVRKGEVWLIAHIRACAGK